MGAFVYMLRCADESYYVGTATGDGLWKRVAEHESGAYKGYTYPRRPVTLVWSEHFDRITDAIVVERRIKGWSRAKKEARWAIKIVTLRRHWSEATGAKSRRLRSAALGNQNRHPEVAAQRPSKGDVFRLAAALARAEEPRAADDRERDQTRRDGKPQIDRSDAGGGSPTDR
jgi:putative endonuclease